MEQVIFSTPIGHIKLSINSSLECVIALEFIEVNGNDYCDKHSEIKNRIDNYFSGKIQNVNLSYFMNGTEFEMSVWNEILKIPYGETRTYKQIANNINKPKAYRAVANACGKNKLALIIPCHRVIGFKNIGGYKWNVNKKKWLLEFEKNNMDKK